MSSSNPFQVWLEVIRCKKLFIILSFDTIVSVVGNGMDVNEKESGSYAVAACNCSRSSEDIS